MGRLSSKVAIVTGAASTRGFGYATARLFAREGAKVVLTDLRADAIAARASELRSEGYDALAGVQDVTSQGAWEEVIALTIGSFGRLDILVNNAGIVEPGGIAESSLTNWDRHISINLTSVFLGCRAAVRQMRLQKSGGSIINISSTAALAAFPNLVAYTASKGGVRLLTKAAALDVAAEGIRINSVHPGHMQTDMMDRGMELAPDLVKAAQANIPALKLGEAEDVAMMNLFLASDEARYTTGTEFVVDGGLTAK